MHCDQILNQNVFSALDVKKVERTKVGKTIDKGL